MSEGRPPPPHDLQVLGLAWLTGLPGSVAALVLVWMGDFSAKVQWTLTSLVVGTFLGVGLLVRERVMRPLHAVANLLAALREGDYSVRGRGARAGDALGEVLLEVNALGATLREQRLGVVEADALLQQVMEEIDVGVLAFDVSGTLRLVNRAGERLLGAPRSQLMGRGAGALGLTDLLEGPVPRRLTRTFAEEGGPYELRRGSFRQGGLPHQLVVLADLRLALREQEREAWRRLVRVLSHEINNSLAPIGSIAEALRDTLLMQPRPSDWEEDAKSGLGVVARRSQSLARFMSAYASLARLPPPTLGSVEVDAWVRRVAALEKRRKVGVRAGPALVVRADVDQLEQLLINLVRNAVDAVLSAPEGAGDVWVSWAVLSPGAVEVWVEDEGPGLPDTGNLFVPFFTTRPQGSGIGLALSRQIAEAHGGSLRLENRPEGKGCRARLKLPQGA
ncbi:sensor histidine kinase [Corallococcus macrosporus]|uniref:histidine kinase n=1 Tax=Myxococcus fulvus (strain ATCC BAA-855 / HW-1) TaxID=483219 RepID=F8CNN1_MYXFH|nr:ATP-binding protein [Corallococcus macrosporus]AEI64048.1 putative sensory box histidine kinase [Corallococcus macrosporus]